MAIIALPQTTRFLRTIEWALDRPAQVNESEYTRKRSIVANPWHGRWAAKCEFVPIVGEANILAWRAFFAQLRGQINTFRLPAVEKAQNSNTGITISSTGQGAVGGNTLRTAGGGTMLLPGQMMTVNDQLLLVTTASSIGSGIYAYTFEPQLRVAAVTGTAVETSVPTCHVFLETSSFGWAAAPGQVYGMSMNVRELI